MPRIKRWFPVTHDINSDPEVWELRDRFGDRSGFVWLEMLSIADRNEGVVGPNSGSIRATLAAKCRTSRAKVESVFGYARDKGWIELGRNIRVRKFAEYHRTRETNKTPPDPPDPPNHPNLPDQKREDRAPPLPEDARARDSFSLNFKEWEGYFEEFLQDYPRQENILAAKEAWMKLCPDKELQEFKEEILTGLRAHKRSSQWTRDNGEYIPHPGNFLLRRQWESTAIPAAPTNTQRTRDILTRHLDETNEEYCKQMGWINCAKCNCAHRPGLCLSNDPLELCDLCHYSHKRGECSLNDVVAHYAANPRRKLQESDEKGCGICRGNDGYCPKFGEAYFVCEEHKRRWPNKKFNANAQSNGNRDIFDDRPQAEGKQS